ncbi:transcriptional regulator [Actinomyces trachealis]|uniref:transcriptional regulator n=1 Tax=Actinomyces trachealis TaxID=2763540 RepID=UPI001FD3299C|nr:transcriptional regulator [Actinomyces trachealis]
MAAGASEGSGGGSVRRRRVVALSAQDAERVSRGELTQEQAEGQRRRGLDALTEAHARGGGVLGGGDGDEHANDARLLAEVPPHWQ